MPPTLKKKLFKKIPTQCGFLWWGVIVKCLFDFFLFFISLHFENLFCFHLFHLSAIQGKIYKWQHTSLTLFVWEGKKQPWLVGELIFLIYEENWTMSLMNCWHLWFVMTLEKISKKKCFNISCVEHIK